MFKQFDNLTIRNVTVEDADLLSTWWNDRKIMAHVGLPNETGETARCIAEKILKEEDNMLLDLSLCLGIRAINQKLWRKTSCLI